MTDLYALHLQYALKHANDALTAAYTAGCSTHLQRSYLATRRDTVAALINLHKLIMESQNA